MAFKCFFLGSVLYLLLLRGVHANASCGSCAVPHKYDADRHQVVYKVGVLNFRGPDSAFAQHNRTFADYLTATAGQRFDPPVSFQMVPVNFQSMFDEAEKGTVDFLYLSPSPFTCVEAEFGAQSLVSHISKRVVGGNTYTLEKFAGVIAVRADNHEIKTLQDLKGKVVASAAISSFGGGAMQFREVINAGMSFINDPKQMVFTGNQAQIVNGVISGKFDIGFVRTDQIERTNDADGNLVDPNLIKVLESKPNFLNGVPFPFEASTQLYPEWNLGAMETVDSQVSREVQAAMLALAEHSKTGEAIQACLDANVSSIATCNNLEEVAPNARCDTTVEIAAIAKDAMTNGKYAGFRTTQNYIEIRAMLQDTGFIQKDEVRNIWKCARPAFLYEAIVCPTGHFKKSKEEVENGCAQVGLQCDEGHQCVCNPCQKAFDVDIFPMSSSDSSNKTTQGCAKMSLCGGVEQRETLRFQAIDNKKRVGAVMNVTVREGDFEQRAIPVYQVDTHVYEFSVSAQRVGILILEVFLDGEQTPESPLRVQVYERQCSENLHEADEDGNCVCTSGAVSMGNACVSVGVVIAIALVPIVLVSIAWVCWYVDKKKKKADLIWSVKMEELAFDEPPTVIGQGSFGLVLLAEYRGTQVAVKRAIPAKGSKEDDLFYDDDTESSTVNRSGQLKNKITANPNGQEDFEDEADLEDPLKHSHHSRNANAGTKSIMKSGMMANSGGHSSGFGFRGWGVSSYGRHKAMFIKEMRLLSKLRHPCITTVMGAVLETAEVPMLVMEYCCHGSLYDILRNETMPLEGDLVLTILCDIASGVRFLHAAKPPVIHGDIKSANILIDGRFRAKVADFGLSTADQKVALGTPYWMGPELLRGDSLNNAASDMYSIGVVVYEIFARKDPYFGEDPNEVMSQIVDRKINKRPPIPSSCPPAIARLMKLLLSGTPSARPTAAELDHRLKELDASKVAPGQNPLSHRIRKDQPSDAAARNEFLYKVFPHHIADVLASGGKPEPESHEIVTIFFSDIVGFTNISSTFSPIKVSKMLDRLYLAFDSLAEKHELFKLETIGDAYLAVSNLVRDQQEDHVKKVAEFAIDAVKAASEVPIDVEDVSKGYVNIRVGFHSGPVVSNVVGNLNPRYGLFGDTVNVASRMESTSVVGKIHCSEKSAHLLMAQAPQIPIKLRGETTVKGKGTMKTYFVENGN
ncbi:Receptor-type guanylate cyclase gcy [Seminavis robusta]|uniref:guanylate cyclase n=1 Tax=Seminavis robusta TaxID=568900 RepID=A0A9N8HUB6_9STRA|nr:Receptor-type guanylate cyclase gcy [Seminavis robusta]|eukprot:Sro1723_g293620.1 Receptor-type guanylate cyclase gcy (1197) ;mRNA; f:1406-6189